jgi:hypothetical protein
MRREKIKEKKKSKIKTSLCQVFLRPTRLAGCRLEQLQFQVKNRTQNHQLSNFAQQLLAFDTQIFRAPRLLHVMHLEGFRVPALVPSVPVRSPYNRTTFHPSHPTPTQISRHLSFPEYCLRERIRRHGPILANDMRGLWTSHTIPLTRLVFPLMRVGEITQHNNHDGRFARSLSAGSVEVVGTGKCT